MSERTPSTSTIRHAWAKAHPFPLTTDVEERYAEFDRWLTQYIAEKRAEWEADGKRQFTAAYQAHNGNVIALDTPTVVQEHAAKTVAEFAEEDPDGPEYFVATRILPPWAPVNENGETP